MAHPPSRSGHKLAISSRARLTLSLLAMVIALLTCGLACGRISAVTLAHAPASALSLDVRIVPSPSQQVLQPEQVVLRVIITDGSDAFALVELRNGQKLACNDVAFPEGHVTIVSSRIYTSNMQVTLPLQPPGGAYTCVYTDEAGRQTALVIPAQSPQMLAPREGDVVPIPRPKAGVTIPAPDTPGPSAGPSPTVGDRTPDQTSSLVVGFALPSLPAGWTAPTAPNYGAV